MASSKKAKRPPKLSPGATVVQYARASSEDERQEPSVETQLDALRAWIERKGYTPGPIFIDRISAGTPVERRPGFRAALRAIRESGGAYHALVCRRVERAFRGMPVMVTAETLLQDAQCRLVGIEDPESPDGEHEALAIMIRNILVSAAEMQKNLTSEMVRDAQAYKFKHGLPHGGRAPFGYLTIPREERAGTVQGPYWVPDEAELFGGKSCADWVRWMFAEALDPKVTVDAKGRPCTTLNLAAMAFHLQQQRVPTPTKRLWFLRTDEQRATIERVRERQKQIWAQSTDLVRRFNPLYAEAWDPTQVENMLGQRVYIGEVSLNGERLPGQHAPLIDVDTFDRVQQALTKHGPTQRRNPTTRNDMLLAQMVTCGGCGGMMTRHQSNEKKFHYACNLVKKSRSSACDNPRHRDFRVHEAAHKALLAGLFEKWEQVRSLIPDPPSMTVGRDDERDALLRERDRVLMLFQKDLITEQELDARMEPICLRLDEIHRERQAPAERARSEAEIEEILAILQDGWDTIPLAVRRQVLKGYVPRGFRLYKHVLTAEVAGIEVVVPVEQGEPSVSDVMPGWAGTVEVARLLGKHENTINYWCRKKKLPAVRLPNGKFRIPEQALVKVGTGYVVAPDAWECCRGLITAYEKAQNNETDLPVEARQADSVAASPRLWQEVPQSERRDCRVG
jgi:DNA invertase Pin-like site-specific DNA recombinase